MMKSITEGGSSKIFGELFIEIEEAHLHAYRNKSIDNFCHCQVTYFFIFYSNFFFKICDMLF